MKTNPKVNIYIALIYRLLLVMLSFQVCRILFFVFNRDEFINTTFTSLPELMLGGVPFDLTATLYINSLFILMQLFPLPFTTKPMWQKVSSWIFFITNGLSIALNIADIVYFKFIAKRTTALVFKEYSNESNGVGIAFRYLVDYWYLVLIFCVIMYLLIWAYKRLEVKMLNITMLKYVVLAPIIFVVGVTLFIGGVRGGFAHSTRPITISNATQYINHLGEESIVMNTPFSILRTLKAETLPRYSTFATEMELEQIYSPIHMPGVDSVMDKKNVMIIIVESLSSQYIGAYNKGTDIPNFKSYTPFLDSLAQHSTIIRHSLATGKKSIDAMASILASIPSLTEPFILTPYSFNDITSIFSLLHKEGYNSSFFHGAPNGSMGMQAFAKKLEIERYFGKTEYDAWRPNNNDFDGMWGISDEPFLEYWAHELKNMPQPFVSTVFTLSSHHPFEVPAKYKDVFTEGTVEMHPVVAYTDMSLRNFFDKIKTEDWYNNTLFVITGDHTNQNAYEQYNNAMGQFTVPIYFFDPMSDKGVEIDNVGSQIDIFPTILGYLRYNKPFFSLGFDLLNKQTEIDIYDSNDNKNFVVNFISGVYNIYNGDYVLQSTGKNSVALYNFKLDKELKNNLIGRNNDIQSRLELLLQGFLQQFNNRMLDNKLGL